MCTHMHADHVGWNTVLEDGRWVPTFPRARYLFSRIEYEHSVAHPDPSPIRRNAFNDSVLPVVEVWLRHAGAKAACHACSGWTCQCAFDE